MKKFLSVIIALSLALLMTVFVSAAEEIEIPLDADHIGPCTAGGAEIVTISDGSITANEIALFALNLPQNVDLDNTVVLHIKGSCEGDFRVWLLADGQTEEKGIEITFSNQWKASEYGVTAPAEFEKYIELTAEDYDAQNMTTANRIAFKGPSYGVNLTNLTIDYVGVIYGSIEEVEADAVAEAQPFADAAAAALEAANAATDEASLNSALADAQSAVDSLTEKSALGFPGVNDLLKSAKDAVKQIEGIINAAAAEEALNAIQGDIDAVNSALTAAQSAGNDIDALTAALTDAQSAAAKIEEAASANNFSVISDASKEAKNAVSEIEDLLKAAEDAKKAEEEAARKAAEEAAAKKKQTIIITVVIVAVVAIIAVIAVVAASAVKKKKK